MATSAVGILATRPEESSLDLLNELERLLRRRVDEQLVQRDGAEDGFDEFEPASFVHQVGLPGGKFGGDAIDQGLQLGTISPKMVELELERDKLVGLNFTTLGGTPFA
jgi:hypothetical protein